MAFQISPRSQPDQFAAGKKADQMNMIRQTQPPHFPRVPHAALTSRGVLVISKRMRETFGLCAGDDVVVYVDPETGTIGLQRCKAGEETVGSAHITKTRQGPNSTGAIISLLRISRENGLKPGKYVATWNADSTRILLTPEPQA